MKTGFKILLLTDFSEAATHATQYARQIASKTNSQMEVMHILQTPVDWVKLPKDREQFYPETREEIAKAKAKLSVVAHEMESSGIKTSTNLMYSFGPENVFAHVNHSNADLVIMGSQGMGADRSFFLGSNAQKVLRNVKTPTLVVKKMPSKPTLEKIAFLSTLEEDQLEVADKIKALAAVLGASIDLVFINTPYNFFESPETDSKFARFEIEFPSARRILINAHTLERGFVMYIESYQPDLLVLAKSDKPGIVKIFSPSLTENLVREQDFPILSIPID
jgi:nucleotide-binding universal stress UspA family protein